MAQKTLNFDSVAIAYPETVANFGLSWFMLGTRPQIKVYFSSNKCQSLGNGFGVCEDNIHLFSGILHRCESHRESPTKRLIIYDTG